VSHDASLTEPAPRTSGAAVASFALGLLALVLLALTGVPALLLGLRGLRAVNAGDGRVGGKRLAVAGILLGGLGTLLGVLGVCVIVFSHLREKSNRVECADNLRRIGEAVNLYCENDGTFPAATARQPDFLPENRLSWLAVILPLLEQEPAYRGRPRLSEKIDFKERWDDPANADVLNTSVPTFLCRSHPDYNPRHRPGLTHYVGIAGLGEDAATLPAKDPRAGFFGYGRRVQRKDVTGGISNTLMALETAHDNGPWLAGGYPTVRGLDPGATRYLGPGEAFGGLHPGGANALMVDGSVRWLSDATGPDALRRLVPLERDPGPE
jgi:prepilin-type processing-associated H-X9-DG protein